MQQYFKISEITVIFHKIQQEIKRRSEDIM